MDCTFFKCSFSRSGSMCDRVHKYVRTFCWINTIRIEIFFLDKTELFFRIFEIQTNPKLGSVRIYRQRTSIREDLYWFILIYWLIIGDVSCEIKLLQFSLHRCWNFADTSIIADLCQKCIDLWLYIVHVFVCVFCSQVGVTLENNFVRWI